VRSMTAGRGGGVCELDAEEDDALFVDMIGIL
jgi:hypothetical protein